MDKGKLFQINFQTFFVSKELCISPLIGDMINFIEKNLKTCLNNFTFSLSVSNGKRIIINSQNIDIKKVKQEDFIEIVEYDPIKNIVIAIGKKDPSFEIPIHWIIQKARTDVNTVLKISNKKMYDICKNTYPIIEEFQTLNMIDKSKVLLKKFQNSKIISIKDEEICIIGLHLKEIEDLFMRLFGD